MSFIPKLTNDSGDLNSLSVLFNRFNNFPEPDRSLIALQNRADRAEQLRVFASTIHEMRNLINGILGLTELLSTTDLDSEQLEYLETLKLNEGYLLTLLNDLLEYSQLESGKQTLDIQEFDLHQFFHKLLNLLNVSEPNKQSALKLFLASNLPQQVKGDARKLQQVIINLVKNGIKFTESGAVNIEVSAKYNSKNSKKTRLKIEVKDRGIGIAPQDIQNIFQPFFQVEKSRKIGDRGVGLGLAISQELVSLMNGKIGVESKLGCGSNFWFTVELELVKRR